MKRRFLGFLSCAIIFSGCGSAGDGTTTQARVDNYALDIGVEYELQESTAQYNSKLGSRPVRVYAAKSAANGFEKNIIVTKLPFNSANSAPEAAVSVMVNTIQKTFGGYEKLRLKSHDLPCGDEELPGYIHSYTINQGTLDVVTTYTLSQYYFFKDQLMYIVSGISDNSDDQANFESYWKSMECRE